ncbi:carbon-nitrogen hydrolase family protein [Kordiimonas sp. SCSIO 12610]|uniref:carbon-nitrogen hydrolase family protein n=1 Tax=Kordiimonas sp. SCSIO 12610 TaxID=2829597 RepID=UPI00210EF599|nr:carbon-nitrogen hydrolase family protein [Kordiimonas sp. SCSIO 12610]UTW54732.1 carbon-nitrogen hydrolase family protein [Kordiimonas sp. SCSIO 12610]
MRPFSIAGIQMYVSATEENVAHMEQRAELALTRFPWLDMLVFSELSPHGPLISHHPKSLTDTIQRFQDLAARLNVWLIPGSMFEHRETGIYNTSVVIDPLGNIVGKYDKMFPFMPYETGVTGGDQFLVFDVPEIGRFGLSICYDIWFPETTRTLAAMGAEVLIHPVLTGTTDRDVELAIARATAAQFQCYVVDINGIGAGGIGRSCIVGPGGDMVYEARGNEEIIPIEIDLDLVRRQRAQGQNGLGQVLKSFRDRNVDFKVYDNAQFDHSYHDGLGGLNMPTRNIHTPAIPGQSANEN